MSDHGGRRRFAIERQTAGEKVIEGDRQRILVGKLARLIAVDDLGACKGGAATVAVCRRPSAQQSRTWAEPPTMGMPGALDVHLNRDRIAQLIVDWLRKSIAFAAASV